MRTQSHSLRCDVTGVRKPSTRCSHHTCIPDPCRSRLWCLGTREGVAHCLRTLDGVEPTRIAAMHAAARTRSLVRLRDGRCLAYIAYGAPLAHPAERPDAVTHSSRAPPRVIVYHHGWPTSALEGGVWDSPARKHGLSVLAVDRPGVAGSSYSPGGFASYVDDIRQLLAHLGLRRVVHVGTSGGGPYACACAALAPATTAGLHLVASMTHCSGPGSGHLMHGMSAVDRLGFACIAHAPCAAALALALAAPAMAWLPTLARMLAAPAHVGGVVGCAAGAGGRAALWLLLSTLPASDRRALLSQPGEVLQVLPQMLADSMRHGSRGLMQDMRRTTLPWGEFDLHSIRAPTVVHQGDADVNVPLNMGRHLAAHIPDAQLRVVPGAAHFSLVLEHAPTIVADIAARCSARGSV